MSIEKLLDRVVYSRLLIEKSESYFNSASEEIWIQYYNTWKELKELERRIRDEAQVL